jgi:hypothetical protein
VQAFKTKEALIDENQIKIIWESQRELNRGILKEEKTIKELLMMVLNGSAGGLCHHLSSRVTIDKAVN